MYWLFIICICVQSDRVSYVNRAIVWLQDKRDASIERSRGPVTRREEGGEYRIGRLKHERVKVPRGNTLLEWAMQVMKCHVHRKSMLEIEFQGEEGTGLGPSLEFYALVAAELQKKELGMWLVDDDFHDKTEREVRNACKSIYMYIKRHGEVRIKKVYYSTASTNLDYFIHVNIIHVSNVSR